MKCVYIWFNWNGCLEDTSIYDFARVDKEDKRKVDFIEEIKMHRLLYYPHFEIQDQNFLKFALLYIDEIRTIIPEIARETLGDPMKNILKNTDLINP